jgi:hypothetical protein
VYTPFLQPSAGLSKSSHSDFPGPLVALLGSYRHLSLQTLHYRLRQC